MSIGGTVTDTVNCGEKVWINTEEKPGYSPCAIYVENTAAARCVQPGDIVWWQSGTAYWTTANKKIVEHKLKKVGFSGIETPKRQVCQRFEASDYENTICERCNFMQREHGRPAIQSTASRPIEGTAKIGEPTPPKGDTP